MLSYVTVCFHSKDSDYTQPVSEKQKGITNHPVWRFTLIVRFFNGNASDWWTSRIIIAVQFTFYHHMRLNYSKGAQHSHTALDSPRYWQLKIHWIGLILTVKRLSLYFYIIIWERWMATRRIYQNENGSSVPQHVRLIETDIKHWRSFTKNIYWQESLMYPPL